MSFLRSQILDEEWYEGGNTTSGKELIISFAQCMKSRKEVILIYTWPALIGILIASKGNPPFVETLKLILAITFVGYSVYFYNDMVDMEEDIKNRELGNPTPAGRPLGSGKISKNRMMKYAIFSGIFGITVAALINIQVLIIQLSAIVLGIIYSTEPIRLKKRFIIKQLTVAAGVIMENFSGGLTLGVINIPIIYLALLNVIFILGINPLVDLRDVRGDKISGIRTIPVVWGPQMTVRFTLGILGAIGAANFIGYLNLGFNLAMTILVFIILASFLYVVFPLLKRWDEPVYLASLINKKIIPLYMSLQFAIFLGFLNI